MLKNWRSRKISTSAQNIFWEDSDAVTADFDKTVWVMNNFLTNAVKHSFQDENIKIVVEKLNAFIQFSIIDTGSGIDEKYHRQIFDRYFEFRRTPKWNRFGLGYFKNFIEKQHGEIGVKSSLNNGSTFYFRLPVS